MHSIVLTTFIVISSILLVGIFLATKTALVWRRRARYTTLPMSKNNFVANCVARRMP